MHDSYDHCRREREYSKTGMAVLSWWSDLSGKEFARDRWVLYIYTHIRSFIITIVVYTGLCHLVLSFTNANPMTRFNLQAFENDI